MENTENHHEKLVNTSAAFSYSWYPTQCDISANATTTSSGSLSQEPYQIMKTDDGDDEVVVIVEHNTAEQASQNNSQFVVNYGNKFTDQQVRVLMKSWKELCDKRQHIRTSESDWHDITDKVNMAPGSAKTVKQVKKKFKNLRDRYRAFKIKNKKKTFGFSKSLYFSQFEQVYGEMDKQIDRLPRQQNNEALNVGPDQGVSTANNTSRLRKSYPAQQTTPVKTFTRSSTFSCRSQFHPGETDAHQALKQPLTTSNDILTVYSQRLGITQDLHSQSNRSIASSSDDGYGTTKSLGGCHMSHNDGGHLDPGLVNAVRELQQQQITMQREMTRNMKQMEERILQEVSTRLRESEDRFRQQIANALTQLGNLIRIT